VEPPNSAWTRWGRNVVLFVFTGLSIFLTGYLSDGSVPAGLELLAGLMGILFAHEMGHYLACRYYRVDATLPFFIPSPWIPLSATVWMPLSFVGTFGAVIRIKSPFPNRKALFDIGIAGPLAGFAVCVPVLILGVLQAKVGPVPKDSIAFADPLLFQWVVAWLKGPVAEGQAVLIGPLGLAAWFGLLVTALNLIPIGQLDGGHVTYALFERRAMLISRLAWGLCVVMIVAVGPTWIVWAILVRLLGMRHPPTLADEEPIGAGRIGVAVLGLAVFVASFMPNPLLKTWADFFAFWRETGLLAH
jgi:membrane-associated protease RseP (regulator of RpoE activity)